MQLVSRNIDKFTMIVTTICAGADCRPGMRAFWSRRVQRRTWRLNEGSLMDSSLADDERPIDGARWIGPRPTASGITAVLLIGTVGMMMCGVQPVLFGTLVNEGRLTAAGLGWTTTAEFLTLGIGIMAAGAWFKQRHLRSRAA